MEHEKTVEMEKVKFWTQAVLIALALVGPGVAVYGLLTHNEDVRQVGLYVTYLLLVLYIRKKWFIS